MHDLHSMVLKVPNKFNEVHIINGVDTNLKLSTNLSLIEIVLPSPHSFLTGTEKVIYFSIFSPIQLSSPLNSSAN